MIKTIIYHLVHKLDYCLQKELKNCDTVLDLGCGPSSPIKNYPHIKYSLGVEVFKPYLDISKKQKIHSKYLQKNILNLDFPKNSFDVVILIEVLEHLTPKNGLKIIKSAQKWAKKKIIISTPNNFFPMDSVDQNIYQKHLSGWSIQKLQSLGFKCHGVSGLKFLYSPVNQVNSLLKNSYYQNIRFKPQKFFYLLNGFFQIFVYYFPSLAFGLFAVKTKND